MIIVWFFPLPIEAVITKLYMTLSDMVQQLDRIVNTGMSGIVILQSVFLNSYYNRLLTSRCVEMFRGFLAASV